MKHLLAALVLANVLLWTYEPMRSAGFIYEDTATTEGCATVPAGLFVPRQFTRWSWCAQVGQSPRAFHLVNLTLHGLVLGLVGALAWSLTRSWSGAWAAVLLMACHPLTVEAVAYAAGGRAELIAAVGVLLACLVTVHGWWSLAPIGLALGLLGKESAIVAVALVPLAGRWRHGVAVWWAALIVGVLAVEQSRGWITGPILADWIPRQAVALARLVALVVVPVGLTVDPPVIAAWPVVLFACVGLGLLACSAWVARRAHPTVALGVAWTLIAATPRLLVPTPLSVFNEHQFYLPLVGVALALAGWVSQT